ncbi:MAG: class I SAM-dependent methyltransferase [Candidatus Lindowbacteria bacterium]|nr:class I SAM-dependent methyltransferase [Candidatus Lindowbacteria bacterium]
MTDNQQLRWNTKELNEIESVTIDHYNSSADSFWEGTRDHDVSQNIEALLSSCRAEGPLDILDFGCGPGRDVKVFKDLGHRPVGLDGSNEFCAMVKKYTGCPTINQSFLSLDLPPHSFDGIFANASLFHIPSQELPRVLTELHNALRPEGILFSSNPRGTNELWQGNRYGHYMECPKSVQYLEEAGFEVVQHYFRPAGKPRHQQPWLAIVSRAIKHTAA